MPRRETFEEPRERYREEIYRSATGSAEGRRTLLSGALAIVTFLLLGALATRQVTSPEHAIPLIEAAIATTTDIDRLIAEDQPALVQLAQSSSAPSFAIPDYPLQVYLARNEVNLPAARLRDVILERSANVVYEKGTDAFDRTGHQSLSRFSSQGMLDLLAGQVSAGTHERASFIAAVLVALLAVLSGAVLSVHTGWSRLKVLGIALLSGAAPFALLSGLAWLAAGRLGGGDTYTRDLQTLARAIFEVPLRDAAVVSAGALLLAIVAGVFGYLDRRFGAGRGAPLSVASSPVELDDEV